MRHVLWLTAAALLVAGCAGAPGHEASAERQPDPRPLAGALELDPSESAALHRAEERGVAACMAERGLVYREAPVVPPSAAGPYGLLTAESAARDGYGLTRGHTTGPPDDPNVRHLATLSGRERRLWEEALKGTPDGPSRRFTLAGGATVRVPADSCVATARRKLYGASWDTHHYQVQDLRNAVVTDTLDDPRVAASERAWADCMREAGFRYGDREAAAVDVRSRLDAAGTDAAAVRKAARDEARVAGQDAECQRAASLAEAVAQAQRRVERDLTSADRALLDAFRARSDAALRRARSAPTTSAEELGRAE
ncbi:hypothetical protein AAH978_18680 [Streptomyces sp. ZYX-F-203]